MFYFQFSQSVCYPERLEQGQALGVFGVAQEANEQLLEERPGVQDAAVPRPVEAQQSALRRRRQDAAQLHLPSVSVKEKGGQNATPTSVHCRSIQF